MAFTRAVQFGSGQNKASSTSVVTGSVTVTAGNLVIVVVAADNTSTGADGDNGEVSSITDSAGGNTWLKAREFTNTNAAAAAGATVSIWYSILVNGLSGGTITANFASARVAKAIEIDAYTLAAGSTVSIVGSDAKAVDGATNFGSPAVTGLASAEHLWVIGVATEVDIVNWGAGNFPNNQNSQASIGTSGGGGASNMNSMLADGVATDTGLTPTSTSTTSADKAVILVAFKEILAVVSKPLGTIQAFGRNLCNFGWVGFGLVVSGQVGTTPAPTGVPRLTIKGGIPLVRPWVGYAEVLQPAIQGPLVTGQPRRIISGELKITRPWIGYAKLVEPAIRGPLVSGKSRRIVKGGTPLTTRWTGTTEVTQPAIRGRLVSGAPRETILGKLNLSRPWIGYALNISGQTGTVVVVTTGAPRQTVYGRLQITRLWSGIARIFEHSVGGKITAGRTTQPSLPLRQRWTGGAWIGHPAIQGALVTGRPREVILGKVSIQRQWIGYALATSGQIGTVTATTGAPRQVVYGRLPQTQRWSGTTRLFTHGLGGRVSGRSTQAQGLPHRLRWAGGAQVGRPAIRGQLVTGSPRRVILGRTQLATRWSTETFSQRGEIGTVQVSPHRAILGRLQLVRQWVGWAKIYQPAIKGPLVTGSPRRVVLGRLQLVRPWIGYGINPRCRIGQLAITTGSPRHTVLGALPHRRQWIGYAQVDRPAIRGSLVKGSPRRVVRAGLNIGLRYPQFGRMLTHPRGGKVTRGQSIFARQLPIRLVSGGYARIVKPARTSAVLQTTQRVYQARTTKPLPWTGFALLEQARHGVIVINVAKHRVIYGAIAIQRSWHIGRVRPVRPASALAENPALTYAGQFYPSSDYY